MTHGILALLDGLGGPELLVIALVVLLLFGSKRMPEIGRGLGRAIREFKRATSSVEDNIREVLYDEPNQPRLRPPAQHRPYRESVATPVAPVAETLAISPTAKPPETSPNTSVPTESDRTEGERGGASARAASSDASPSERS